LKYRRRLLATRGPPVWLRWVRDLIVVNAQIAKLIQVKLQDPCHFPTWQKHDALQHVAMQARIAGKR
jgi:hypothetical protein